MDFAPIVLKELVLSCGITQTDLQRSVAGIIGRDVSLATMNLCVNRGYIPSTMDGFQVAVEQSVANNEAAMAWLDDRKLTQGDIWAKLDCNMRRALPVGHSRRIRSGLTHKPILPRISINT